MTSGKSKVATASTNRTMIVQWRQPGQDPGCYIELSRHKEWDNAIEALQNAVAAFNFAEDCNGLSQFEKNLCKRYANLTYDLIDRIEASYR